MYTINIRPPWPNQTHPGCYVPLWNWRVPKGFLKHIWTKYYHSSILRSFWGDSLAKSPFGTAPGMYKTRSNMGHLSYQLVQDFLHQQYQCKLLQNPSRPPYVSSTPRDCFSSLKRKKTRWGCVKPGRFFKSYLETLSFSPPYHFTLVQHPLHQTRAFSIPLTGWIVLASLGRGGIYSGFQGNHQCKPLPADAGPIWQIRPINP